jgi:competence protein ComEC
VFRSSLAALACFGLLISVHPFAPHVSTGSLEVTALDCGSGQALFAVLPDGSTMLIGTGSNRPGTFGSAQGVFARPRWDPAEDIVSPYLWSRGLKGIDLMVLTTAVHASGATALVDNFHIGEIWYARTPSDKRGVSIDPLPLILEKARERGVRLRQIAAEDTFSRGGGWIKVLPALRVSNDIDDSETNGRDPADRLKLEIAVGVATPAPLARNESNTRERAENTLTSAETAVLVDRNEIALVTPSQVLARVVSGIRPIPRVDLPGHPLDESARRQWEGTPTFRTETDGAVTLRISSGGVRIRCEARPCGPSVPLAEIR